MARIRSSRLKAPRSASSVSAPSLSTTAWSAASITSSSRCEMKITALPCALSRAMAASTSSVSCEESEAVGSSRISRRGFSRIALAISTICRSAALSSLPMRVDFRAKPISANCASAASCRRFCRMNPRPLRGSSPKNRFSPTDRSGRIEVSCRAKATPARRAALGEAGRKAAPSSAIAPPSAGKLPAQMCIRVDLPAPFSPTSETISPARTEKDTSRSTLLAPRLSTPAPLPAAGTRPALASVQGRRFRSSITLERSRLE